MIAITVPAQSYDLTVLATVKAELGITDGSSDEKLLTLIRQASDTVSKYCRRVFAKETVSETFRLSTVTESLLLARYPVASIASITEVDTVLDVADYEVNAASGVLTRLSNDEPACWSASKIIVLYSAGYELLTDLPHAIERACIELVKDYYYSMGRDPRCAVRASTALDRPRISTRRSALRTCRPKSAGSWRRSKTFA